MLCERGIHDLAGDALLFVEKDRHKLFGTAIAFSSNKLSDEEEGRNRESEERAWKPASFPRSELCMQSLSSAVRALSENLILSSKY